MTFTEINKKVKNIRALIKKVKFEDALQELEDFIELTGDKELDKEVIALTARYNIDKKAGRIGVKSDYKNQNEIIYAITDVLNETKEIAFEKATMEKGEELDKLNELGNEIINRLEKMTMLMIEGKLLEMENRYAEHTPFKERLNLWKREEKHIKRLKEIIKTTETEQG